MFDLRSWLEGNAQVQTKTADGSEYVVRCRCDAARKSERWHLWVNVNQGKGICFRCGVRLANAPMVVSFLGGISEDEARRLVSRGETSASKLLHAIESLEVGVQSSVDRDDPGVSLPVEFVPVRRALPQYARERGLSIKTCVRYRIGMCPRGLYANRLVVPVYSPRGVLVSFVARWMGDPPKGVKKVLYPKGSRISRYLFNEAAASSYRMLVVCEGVFDAIRVGSNAVALGGKHASEAQVERLVRLGASRRIVVLLDSDARDDAEALCERLAPVVPDVRLGVLPAHRKDPGESPRVELYDVVCHARRWGARSALDSCVLM